MLFDSMIQKESASVDLFDSEQELSVMVFEEGEHEISLHSLDGICKFKTAGRGKGCYRFVKREYNGTYLMRAITSSYVLIKRVVLGT